MSRYTGYNPAIHDRQSIRLKGYDYSSPGNYFITICCQDRKCLFGQIENKEMKLNDIGRMIDIMWQETAINFPHIILHEYIVMPNHFHAIVGVPLVGTQITKKEEGQPQGIAPTIIPAEGQPQGIAPTIIPAEGQPQGIAPTIIPAEGQPQGIAPTIAPTITPTIPGKMICVGDIVGAFKSKTTVKYIEGVRNRGWPEFKKRIWQRNYWEHIIRDDRAFNNISEYIRTNPERWVEDKLNPENPEIELP